MDLDIDMTTSEPTAYQLRRPSKHLSEEPDPAPTSTAHRRRRHSIALDIPASPLNKNLRALHTPLLSPLLPPSDLSLHSLFHTHYTCWALHYRFHPSDLGTTFAFHVFLGPRPGNPQDWELSPNRVGGHGVSASVSGSGKVLAGIVPLTKILLERLGTLEDEVVLPYLRDSLCWCVQRLDGSVVDLREFGSLRVKVASAVARTDEEACSPVVETLRWKMHDTFLEGDHGGFK